MFLNQIYTRASTHTHTHTHTHPHTHTLQKKLETGLRQADSDSDLTRCLKLSNTCNLSHSQFPSLEMEMIRVFSYLRVIDRKK